MMRGFGLVFVFLAIASEASDDRRQRSITLPSSGPVHHRSSWRRNRAHEIERDDSPMDSRCRLRRTVSSVPVERGGAIDQRDSISASPKVLQSMRLLYLTYYASLGSLLPYLPVYFHSLGLDGSSIGLLGAVKPITTFIVAPLWVSIIMLGQIADECFPFSTGQILKGIISDRFDNHVTILQLTFLTSLVFQLLVGVSSSVNRLVVTVFAAAVLNAPVKSLIDSIVMNKLTSVEDRYQFGRMRLWGQLGFGAGSSLVGSLLSAFPADPVRDSNEPTAANFVNAIEKGIEVASETDAVAETAAVSTKKAYDTLIDMTRDVLRSQSVKGYQWAFLTHAVLSIPVFFCIRTFRPTIGPTKGSQIGETSKKQQVDKNETTNAREGLMTLAKNRDALIFFFLVFVIGTSSGCIENFAYVRVREVGGTGNNMGVLRLVSSLAGAPMFWYSGPLTEKLGTDVVLVLSLLAYSARFFNYAYMQHPYHALPAEALRGLTFALFWSSGSVYAHKISPPGMKATMLLLMNAMYGGLGQSLGAIIGGRLQSNFGTARAFMYSGVFDACFVACLMIYLVSQSERVFTLN